MYEKMVAQAKAMTVEQLKDAQFANNMIDHWSSEDRMWDSVLFAELMARKNTKQGVATMTENVCILFLLIDIWLSLGILGVFQKLENRWPWGLVVFTLGIPLLTFIAYTI